MGCDWGSGEVEDYPVRERYRRNADIFGAQVSGQLHELPTYSRAKELAQEGGYQQPSAAAVVETFSVACFNLLRRWIEAENE